MRHCQLVHTLAARFIIEVDQSPALLSFLKENSVDARSKALSVRPYLGWLPRGTSKKQTGQEVCDSFTAPGTLTPRTARLRLLLSSPHCRSKPLHSLVIWDSAAAVASVLHFCNCRQLDRLSTAGSWTLLQLRHPPSPLRPMPVDLFYWSLCCRPHRTYTVAAGFIPRRTTAAKLFK
jgi:hypothetical protein